MRNVYIDDLKNALRSKEYWFGFTIIVISSVITSIQSFYHRACQSHYIYIFGVLFVLRPYRVTVPDKRFNFICFSAVCI